jgi:hypothetical protein
LRQLVRYDEATGKLFWKARKAVHFGGSHIACKRWNGRWAEKEALSFKGPKGYLYGSLLKTLFFAHRVAWAVKKRRWPLGDIDHINGDRADNRIENLREASKSQNSMNQKARCNNKSGFKGVRFYENAGKFGARIQGPDGKRLFLGLHATPEAAHAAYCAAASELFGRFFNSGTKEP